MDKTLSNRHNLILEMLNGKEGISVSEISKKLSLSVVTIRTDLRFLENIGLIYRSKGKVYNNLDVPMNFRFKKRLKEKTSIAKAAALLVDDYNSIMICQGSTAALVPSFLGGKRGLQIVTNSFQALDVCKNNDNLEISIIGGKYNSLLDANVGPKAIEQVNNYYTDILFIGADGVSLDFGVSTAKEENALLLQKMFKNASKTVLLVDSTKIGIRALNKIFDINELTTIITDPNCPSEFKNQVEALGVSVVISEIN